MYVCMYMAVRVHVHRQRYTVSSMHSTVHLNESLLPELIGFPRLKRFHAFSLSASSPCLVHLSILPSFTFSKTFTRNEERARSLCDLPQILRRVLSIWLSRKLRSRERLAESSFTSSGFKSRTMNDLERTGLENVGIRRRIVSERRPLSRFFARPSFAFDYRRRRQSLGAH